MVTAKFSTNFEAVRSRIKRLPKLMEKTLQTQTKKDAVELIRTYQEGLKSDTFNLDRLKDSTIRRKINKNYSQPETPLFAAGDSLDRTLYNGLIIINRKNKYVLKFSDKKHHEADLTINQLHQIHENGCVFIVKGTNTLIRIPPRQAWAKAIARFMRKKKDKENVFKVKRAILDFIRTNSEKQFNVINKYNQREKEVLAIAQEKRAAGEI